MGYTRFVEFDRFSSHWLRKCKLPGAYQEIKSYQKHTNSIRNPESEIKLYHLVEKNNFFASIKFLLYGLLPLFELTSFSSSDYIIATFHCNRLRKQRPILSSLPLAEHLPSILSPGFYSLILPWALHIAPTLEKPLSYLGDNINTFSQPFSQTQQFLLCPSVPLLGKLIARHVVIHRARRKKRFQRTPLSITVFVVSSPNRQWLT